MDEHSTAHLVQVKIEPGFTSELDIIPEPDELAMEAGNSSWSNQEAMMDLPTHATFTDECDDFEFQRVPKLEPEDSQESCAMSGRQQAAAECGKKWINLRDTYRKNTKKGSDATKSGSGARTKRPWFLVESMSCLRDFALEPRAGISNDSRPVEETGTPAEESRRSFEKDARSAEQHEEPEEYERPDQEEDVLTTENSGVGEDVSQLIDQPAKRRRGVGNRERPRLLTMSESWGSSSSSIENIATPQLLVANPTNHFQKSHGSSKKTRTVTDADILDCIRNTDVPAKVLTGNEHFCLSLVEPMGRLTLKKQAAFKRIVYGFLEDNMED